MNDIYTLTSEHNFTLCPEKFLKLFILFKKGLLKISHSNIKGIMLSVAVIH